MKYRNRYIKDTTSEVYDEMEETLETLRQLESMLVNLEQFTHETRASMISDMRKYKDEYNVDDYKLRNLIDMLNDYIPAFDDASDYLENSYREMKRLSRK